MSHNMKSQENVMKLQITCFKRMVTYHSYQMFGIIIEDVLLYNKAKSVSLTKGK